MKKVFNIIGLFLLIGGLIFIAIRYQDKKVRKEFDLFNSSHLSGTIVMVDKYSRSANFVLNNNPTEFSFYPFIDKNLNNNEIFQYVAKPGDSIYKPAYSDILLLIKGNKVYSYTFQNTDQL